MSEDRNDPLNDVEAMLSQLSPSAACVDPLAARSPPDKTRRGDT